MTHAVLFITFAFCLLPIAALRVSAGEPVLTGRAIFCLHQPPMRLALIGLKWTDGAQPARSADQALAQGFALDGRVVIIDGAQLRPALAGVGYDGSTNLTREEARRLGSAMGCDFFIIGKAETLTRSERENQSHEETLIALMIVDGRSGRLAVFDFISEKATSREASFEGAVKTLATRAPVYVDRMLAFRAARSRVQTPASSADDPVEDVPEEGSARSIGFIPPEFLNRVKPEYTTEADRAGISATVEATAVFHRDGRVGEVEIIRWAGYGLDESAARAIRQLKFKPATRDGRAVSVRAVVRYNFRRVGSGQ
ncbi:MAG TPA: energy transducer TonB [Blastocatellia bacterium]|nr:energy transducer TonB [Blastocatellia bacterium]